MVLVLRSGWRRAERDERRDGEFLSCTCTRHKGTGSAVREEQMCRGFCIKWMVPERLE